MRSPTKGIDYTDKDYESFKKMMIAKLKELMPEYTDTSSTDAGIVILECLANGLDIVSLYNDAIANDCFLPTTQDRSIAVMLARQLGYFAKNQTASITKQVFVLSDVQETETIIPKGTVVATESDVYNEEILFETDDVLVIPANCKGDEQDEQGNYKYTVDVVQGSQVIDDVLGTSTGLPYQTFTLGYTEVLTDSIQLYIDEGDGQKLWEQVESFKDSDEKSLHYTVTIDDFGSCTIEFGSGARGKIPAIVDGGIVASYRVGGGTIGNVKAHTITVFKDTIAYVDSTFNPEPSYVLGHDKESIDEIKANAPAYFRTQDRAVTSQDYGDLVRTQFFEVLDSVGVPSSDEKLEMNVYYLMRENYEMDEELEKKITDYLSSRVIIGTTFNLLPYEEYVVDIEADLRIDRDFIATEIRDYVEDYVKNSFFGYGNFKFGDTFTCTDLEHEVSDTFSGVMSFRISSPTSNIVSPPKENQVIKLGTLTLNVSGGR